MIRDVGAGLEALLAIRVGVDLKVSDGVLAFSNAVETRPDRFRVERLHPSLELKPEFRVPPPFNHTSIEKRLDGICHSALSSFLPINFRNQFIPSPADTEIVERGVAREDASDGLDGWGRRKGWSERVVK